MINYRLKIDFLDSKTLASDICFVSGDVKSSTLYFEFYNDGQRVDISGYELSVRAKRSDGVVVASSGKIKDNTAVFAPESNMYCVPGELYMEIALTNATGKYATTKIITAEVIEGLGEAAIEAVDNLNVYVKLISDAISAKEEAKAAAEVAKNVHPEIRDGIWWVYDADKATMVSSGIKAEGSQGVKGEKGDQGIPGYTPQREVDYWTLEDKNSINKYVDDALEEISDTLNTKINETSEHLGEKVENLQNQYSNALKGNVNGEVVSITDVSPVEHNLGIKVSSKNVVDLSQAPFYINRANIIEQTNDTLKLETTVTGSKWTSVHYELPENLIGETMTLSATWEMSNPNSQGALRVQWANDVGTVIGDLLGYLNVSGQARTFTVSEKPEGAAKLTLIVYAVADSTNGVVGDTVTYKNIQLEKGAAVTAFTPYVKTDDIRLTKFGKNLIPYPYRVDKGNGFFDAEGKQTRSGITATDLGDGGVLLNGTATTAAYIHLHYTNIGSRYISGRYGKNGKFYANKYNENIYVEHHNTNHITYIVIQPGTTCDNVIYYPQIEVGSVETEYEKGIPYETFTPNADGTINAVKSVYSNATLITNNKGVLIGCEYNKDINKAFAELQNAIISLGGNV